MCTGVCIHKHTHTFFFSYDKVFVTFYLIEVRWVSVVTSKWAENKVQIRNEEILLRFSGAQGHSEVTRSSTWDVIQDYTAGRSKVKVTRLDNKLKLSASVSVLFHSLSFCTSTIFILSWSRSGFSLSWMQLPKTLSMITDPHAFTVTISLSLTHTLITLCVIVLICLPFHFPPLSWF